MAPAVKPPKPGKTGTPKGMEGVRPGSPQAIKAGYKPPSPPKAPGKPGGAPFAVSFNANGTTTLKPPTAASVAAPPPTPTAAPVTPFNYANAFYADPRYAAGVAGITQTQLGIGTKYGLTLNRDTNPSSPTYGMVKYRVPGSTAGAGDITAKVDPTTGAMTYSDSTGKTYNVADLELDYVPIRAGDDGYLEGQLGQTQAGSEKRQFEIGDVAARTVGARRSGMRAQAGLGEAQALQGALRNLALGIGGEQAGVTQQYANLLNTIYPDLVKQAESYAASIAPVAAPEATAAPEAPSAPAGASGMPGVPQKPLPAPRTISVAGQDVSFPKGINLAGVDVQGIGRRIANNIAAAGGVKKLKPGQRVGEFRAGDKGYRVFYRGGKFVIEAIG